MGKTKKKAPKKVKKGYTICSECGTEYRIGAPHRAFCPPCTCSECGTSVGYALPIYDSREDPPIRLCDNCLSDRLDEEEDDLDTPDDDYEDPEDTCDEED